MAEKKTGLTKEDKRKLVLSAPRMTVLTDNAIEDFESSQFDLLTKLAPIYDIIRHPQTQTPLACAIYGDWGTGKTTAMRVLESMLKKWNEEGKPPKGQKKIKLYSVRFDPWKYSSREDVWRGLIAELIIASTRIEGADKNTVLEAARQFTGFLGKTLLLGLSSASVKVQAGVAEAEYDFSILQEIGKEFSKINRPEKAFLNEFEELMKKWLAARLGKDDDKRFVIFIDDLDRSLPDVVLEVLEALKLYLAIPNLIFVLGLDRSVVDALVRKYYKDQEIDLKKADKYLDKMFQVEIYIAPPEEHVSEYYLEVVNQLDELSGKQYWAKMQQEYQRIFNQVIKQLTEHNPREIKRMMNSGFIAGVAAAEIEGANAPTRFSQGLQVFLIMKILNAETNFPGEWVGTAEGIGFFDEWSKIIVENNDSEAPGGQQLRSKDDFEDDMDPPQVSDHYSEFFKSWSARLKRRRFYQLYRSQTLFRLLKIGFSPEVAGRTAKLIGPESPSAMPPAHEVVAGAIASQLEKPVNQLRPEDYERVTGLDLNFKSISNLSPIQGLTNLQTLACWRTQVSDLSPIQSLTNLQTLYCGATQVSDLSPIKGLTNLQKLYCGATQVSDLSPIQGLKNLTDLSIWGAPVTDFSVIQNMPGLKTLQIGTGQFSLKQIKGLEKARPDLKIEIRNE